ncbi:MAG TPA: helix-turn-helix transcriptional regulator [Candidatus Aquabacterium excrementipullorum]|nr:helix-turn-helix transcriptional regulator [Candidatus Aquabacterium excrementipullorum]
MAERSAPVLAFGPFLLYRTQRRLLEDGQPVRLGSRAMDLLIALVEQAGQVVGQSDLMSRVWPREVVEDNTLRVHIAALRKALGDGQRYITNVPGRGYGFVAEVRPLDDSVAAPPPSAPPSTRLPPRMARMVGRREAVTALVRQLQDHRFVTIVGAGGMGKTTVALSVADAVAPAPADGAWFVDLSALAPGSPVVEAFASALEVPTATGELLARLSAHLRDKQMLVVVDNCEHVVEPLAAVLEALLQACPGLRVLATSREPVRAAGEWVHLLPALEFPRGGEPLGMQQALSFPAVQLFVERATASDDSFVLDDDNAPLVVEVCRQLDGIPLAIELTAALVRVFSLRGVSDGLGDKLLALRSNRRMVVSRHQTLHAMLDWSHQLLPPFEKAVLNRLSVFRGGMTIDAAIAVASDDVIGRADVRDAIASLSSKSWLYADVSAEPVRFHMHGVARTFANEQLRTSGASDLIARRHADHLCNALRKSRSDWPLQEQQTWLDRYAPLSADVRAAITWTLEQEGGALLAEAMMADAWMLGFQLHQFADYEALARRVLRQLEAQNANPLARMRMHRIIALFDGPQIGPRSRDTQHSEEALALARQHGSPRELIESLMIRYIQDVSNGDYQHALAHGEDLAGLAPALGDPMALPASERMRAPPLHLLGRHDDSRVLAERVLAYPAWAPSFGTPSSAIDHQVGMRIVLARIAWLQGRADQAVVLCEDLLAITRRESGMSLCQAIGLAALPIRLWRGELAQVSELSARLRDEAARQALSLEWAPWVDAIEQVVQADTADVPGSHTFKPAANSLFVDHLATFSVHGLEERALQRVRAGHVGWCAPEVLRVKALSLWSAGTDDARAQAEALLQESLNLAHAQGALAWALRTATSIALLWQDGPSHAEGQAMLHRTLAGFSEGLDTRDLRAARAALD